MFSTTRNFFAKETLAAESETLLRTYWFWSAKLALSPTGTHARDSMDNISDGTDGGSGANRPPW